MEEQTDDLPDIELPDIKTRTTPLVIPELPAVCSSMSDAEINRIHLQLSNVELQVIHALWPQVKSIAGVTRLIETSIKAVKHQRDLMCLPYGYKGEATRKDVIFPPLDD